MDAKALIASLERKYDRQEKQLKQYVDIDHDSFTDHEFRILDRGMHLGSMLAYEMAIILVERMSKDDRNE
ncbi:hypothetical protein MG295_00014 [Bacillus phage vB_BcgM]|nr:hypothetical protein MG295_00014 [Bacillus phage vB_BcgM]